MNWLLWLFGLAAVWAVIALLIAAAWAAAIDENDERRMADLWVSVYLSPALLLILILAWLERALVGLVSRRPPGDINDYIP